MAETAITLGGTEVKRIGLGTNRLTNTPENVEFIRAAVGAGLAHIDTAFLYTSGESEATIGAALDLPRPGCVVATKGGYRAGEGRPDVLRGQLEESLGRLGTGAIDLYYLHRVHPDTPLEDSLAVIAEYHGAGRIRHVGISEVSVDQIERARAVVPITAVQNRYNLGDREHDGVIDHCAREGIVFVPYYPLRGTDSAAVTGVAERRGATASQVALAWLLHRSPAVLPIPGTLSLDHLTENLAALEIELADDELRELG
ncbi:MAG TPA: aldo/keto reductase [Gaiellales bacterium]|jgi:aryl-alcohol dehydrogenase-like predicted oxidoreductase|nr:aldo/keto reductase [Gaiellales bacterium]